jgi:small-conductance mechanosensitive channel
MKIHFCTLKNAKFFNYFSRLQTHVLFMVFFACSMASTTAMAQTTQPMAQTTQPTEQPVRTSAEKIMVYNREIATFRSPLLGGSPSTRARIAEQRINDQLKRSGSPVVTSSTNPLGSIIQMDGSLAFVITPNDVDKLNGETLDSATKKAITNLQQVINASKESRDSKRILNGLGITGIATLLMLALFWLLNRAKRFADKKLLALTHKKKITLFGADVFSRGRIIRVFSNITRSVYWVIAFLLSYEWLSISLGQFPYTRPWSEQLNQFLFDLFLKLSSEIIKYIPNLVTAIAIFLLARFINSIFKSFFERIQRGETVYQFLDPELAVPTRKIANVAVWIFALVMAYPYLPGSGSDAFKGISVLVGLMISLGATNIIGQGASGMIITFSRTFKVGEYVRIGDNEGTVTELGMFTTRLRTGMGEEISLSNSLVFGAVTRNYSRAVPGSGYILDTVVTIGYDTPWRQVEAMLLEAANSTDGISKENEYKPKVFQTSLSDFYPEYRLVCYASPENPLPRAVALSTLHANIQDVFNQYGVQIMSPHYVMDPNAEKVVTTERKYLAPAKPAE